MGLDITFIRPLMLPFIIYLLLITTCVAVYFVRRNSLPASFRYLALMLLLVLSVEVADYFLRQNDFSARPLHHVYQPLEFILIAIAYKHSFQSGHYKRIVNYAIPGYIIVALLGAVFIDGIYNWNTVAFQVNSFVLVVFSILYIYELYQRPVYENVLKIPFFWVNTGILFYCTGTFFQMGFHHYVEAKDPQLAKSLNLVNQVLNYFLYSCYLKAFLCKTQTSSS